LAQNSHHSSSKKGERVAWDKINRRLFLQGLGGFTMSLPLLPSLIPREARAQLGLRKRFITIHQGHCQAVEQWSPNPTKLTFAENQQYARAALLSQISGSISPVIGPAFDSLRGKINVISRLDGTFNWDDPENTVRAVHHAEVVLGGGVKAQVPNTLDQIISQKLYGKPSLNLYVQSPDFYDYSLFSAVSIRNSTYQMGERNPTQAFKDLFGSSGAPSAPAPDTRIPARNLAVVDRVLADYKSLRASPRIAKEDVARLDAHIELVAEVEASFKAAKVEPAACSTEGAPTSSPVGTTRRGLDYDILLKQMFKVLEIGIKCGQVNVATLMLHSYDYFSGAGILSYVTGVSGELHNDYGHAISADRRAQKQVMNQYYGRLISDFIKSLDVEEPGTGRTYLDNSLVLWANDQGTLKDCNSHSSINMPVLLAGSAGGAIRTGRFIEYGPAYASTVTDPVGGDDGRYRRGRTYNQLLVSIAQAMGLQPADYERPGTTGFGFYGKLTSQYDYLGNHKRDFLPLLKAG